MENLQWFQNCPHFESAAFFSTVLALAGQPIQLKDITFRWVASMLITLSNDWKEENVTSDQDSFEALCSSWLYNLKSHSSPKLCGKVFVTELRPWFLLGCNGSLWNPGSSGHCSQSLTIFSGFSMCASMQCFHFDDSRRSKLQTYRFTVGHCFTMLCLFDFINRYINTHQPTLWIPVVHVICCVLVVCWCGTCFSLQSLTVSMAKAFLASQCFVAPRWPSRTQREGSRLRVATELPEFDLNSNLNGNGVKNGMQWGEIDVTWFALALSSVIFHLDT